MGQIIKKAFLHHRMKLLTAMMLMFFSLISGVIMLSEFDSYEFDYMSPIMIQFFFGLPSLCMVLGSVIQERAMRKSNLTLYENCVAADIVSAASGNVTSFRIPLDQIRSVKVKRNRLVIRAANGNYTVNKVEKPMEFANAVMAQTEQYRAQIQAAQQQQYYTEEDLRQASNLAMQAGLEAASHDPLKKMQTLERMRTNGLISQEDYEQKKNEVLAQM